MSYIYPYTNKKNYRTLSSYNVKNDSKILGQTKHYPVGVKEWPNSVYAFNKSYYNSYDINLLVNRIIKSYFNMDKNLLSSKSKRMRDLIKRSSTRRVFVSKSLVKQTNDKAMITIFLFDRMKKKLNKKLFYLKNDLNLLLNNNITRRKMKRKQYSKLVSRYNVNYNNYSRLLNYNLINKKQSLKTLFFFYFLTWSLSAFNLKVGILRKGDKLVQGSTTHIVSNNMFIIYSYKHIGTHIMKNNVSKIIYLNTKEQYKIMGINNKFTLDNVVLLNDLLYRYLCIILCKCSNKDILKIKNKVYLLFTFFRNKYYKIFIRKYLRKEYLALNYLYKLYLNRAKINELLPGLKYILSKVYNKKIELNIINLKYFHLNSDIFTSAIIIKLRKKTSKLLRILKKSLKLVKIPTKIRTDVSVSKTKILYLNRLYTGVNIRSLYNLTKQSYLNTNGFKDKLNNILDSMFYMPNYKSNLHSDILASLKYKWITGARLEAKGRLTKRFTASRSLFKFKYKGNLQNMDHLNKSVNNSMLNVNNTSNLYMIRNEFKPNIQYTASNSKKRIGTFGIKGWISNN